MNTDRVVLITGAVGGIGTPLVERFLANSDTVAAADTRQDVLDSRPERWPTDARQRQTGRHASYSDGRTR